MTVGDKYVIYVDHKDVDKLKELGFSFKMNDKVVGLDYPIHNERTLINIVQHTMNRVVCTKRLSSNEFIHIKVTVEEVMQLKLMATKEARIALIKLLYDERGEFP